MPVQIRFTADHFFGIQGNTVAESEKKESKAPFESLVGVPDCPPKSAKSQNKTFFACHEFEVPGPTDFRTAAKTGKFPLAPECARRSNSVMATIDDAKALMERFALVYKYISQADVVSSDGVWQHTPTTFHPSHHSLWLYSEISMHAIFNKRIP
jgi:hypothetical protein